MPKEDLEVRGAAGGMGFAGDHQDDGSAHANDGRQGTPLQLPRWSLELLNVFWSSGRLH